MDRTTGNLLPDTAESEANVQNPADWVPEARDVPPELTEEFEHETFPPKPVYFPPLSERLPAATVRQLMEMAHGKAPTDD